MSQSMFAAIAEAVGQLKVETDRINSGTGCVHSIQSGELDKILAYARRATAQLKKVEMAPGPLSVGGNRNHYLADKLFVEAVNFLASHENSQAAGVGY